MANQFFQPELNPVKFSVKDFANIPQYVSKFMDDFLFYQTIKDWEEPARYCQPWLKDDAIRCQFVSNYTPISIHVFDMNDNDIFQQVLTTGPEDTFRPGYFIRQFDLDLAPFDVGYYYLVLVCGGGPSLTLVSEPFIILPSSKNTLLLEYTHFEMYEDVLFTYTTGEGTLFSPSLRIPGRIKYFSPESVDTLYKDQRQNNRMVKSIPFDSYELTVGGAKGVPPWVAKKVNRIMGCDSVMYDGLLFAKATENQKWELTIEEDYPMAGWKIQIVKKLNHPSKIYDSEVEITNMNSMMAIVDTKGFGVDDDGGNFLEIEDVN